MIVNGLKNVTVLLHSKGEAKCYKTNYTFLYNCYIIHASKQEDLLRSFVWKMWGW